MGVVVPGSGANFKPGKPGNIGSSAPNRPDSPPHI
jgi:hypothetical protein